MKILIIEDEAIIARRITRMTKEYFHAFNVEILHIDELSAGIDFLKGGRIDLLLLDLNLSGEDGFEILKHVSADTFHTIIISAYADKAIYAFEYGVLDFVAKPFNRERLFAAFKRYDSMDIRGDTGAKFLIVQKQSTLHQVPVESIILVKGARIYSELYLADGKVEVHNKSLDALCRILPGHFTRVHKSYIVNMKKVKSIDAKSGGNYSLKIDDQTSLPVSRSRYKDLRKQWFNE